MNGVLISLLNVAIVLGALLMAAMVAPRDKAAVEAWLLVGAGAAAYGYEIYTVLQEGRCVQMSEALLDLLAGLDRCIGTGDHHLAMAQVALLAGVLVLGFLPLRRWVERNSKQG